MSSALLLLRKRDVGNMSEVHGKDSEGAEHQPFFFCFLFFYSFFLPSLIFFFFVVVFFPLLFLFISSLFFCDF